MLEVLLSMILIFTVFNFLMLYRLMGKRQTNTDTALYEEQIKSLKKIVRLNEKCLKITKEAQNEKSMEQARTEEKPSLVYPEEQHRIY